ncbi:MAG: hypothetical protein ACRDUY_01725 [Nitriliruptorales bacterium]
MTILAMSLLAGCGEKADTTSAEESSPPIRLVGRLSELEPTDIAGGECPLVEKQQFESMLESLAVPVDRRAAAYANLDREGDVTVLTCRVELAGEPRGGNDIWNEPALAIIIGGPTERFGEPEEMRLLSDPEAADFPYTYVPLPSGQLHVYAWSQAFVGIAWSEHMTSMDSREVAERIFNRGSR